MKFTIKNFGCRTNLAEAMEWAETLSNNGYIYTGDFREAEILILNSCVLTKSAENEVRRFLNKIKGENSKFVILTGCLTSSLKSIGNFYIVENEKKGEIPFRIIEEFGKLGGSKDFKLRARANVKIQEGCNFKCSFCIIPQVRGNSRSVEEEKIYERVKDLVNKGFKEIVISGTHINSWGIDLKPKRDLIHLLKTLDGIEGLKRIRLTSLDPRFLSDSFIEELSNISKIAHHFHLSLQNCSEKTLKNMNRKGSPEIYSHILNYIREKFPDACIGADIIVGFPGEEDKDFEDTYNFLKNSSINYLHVFPFSPREGTPASSMPQISGDVKKKRVRLLRILSFEKRKEFYSKFNGRKLSGIVIKKNGDKAEVLTHNYIKLILNSNFLKEGDEVEVLVSPENSFITKDFVF
jgi:threonylcarbamoyladenosine tRNA methylthiotransferase MtaB